MSATPSISWTDVRSSGLLPRAISWRPDAALLARVQMASTGVLFRNPEGAKY